MSEEKPAPPPRERIPHRQGAQPEGVRSHKLHHRDAGEEPEVLRTDFFNSLLAAYRPSEVEEQLERAGLDPLSLEVVSDRHFIVWGVGANR